MKTPKRLQPLVLSWRAEVEEPGTLPLPPGKGGAQPKRALPALLTACPGDDGASNKADMSWKEMMKGEGK